MDIDINDASSGEAKAFASTLSPRTSYALQKRRADYLTMDIMMNLDADSIGEIRKEFERKENNVDMFEFVRIMKNALPEELEVRDVSGGSDEQQDGLGLVRRKPSSAELVANLVELFREIDLNGDHLMDWTEMVMQPVGEPGVKRQTDMIERVQYIDLIDSIAVIEPRCNHVRMVDFESLRSIGLCQLKSSGVPEAMTAFEAVNPYLVVSSSDSTMSLFNLAPGNQQFRLLTSWPTSHAQSSLAWSKRYTTLYSGSSLGAVHCWDVHSREEVSTIADAHTDIVQDLCSVDELDCMVSASIDRTVAVWDTCVGALRQRLVGHRGGVVAVDYSSDRQLLISASYDHDAIVWSPFVSQMVYTLKGHNTPLVGVKAVPNSPEVITGSVDGMYKIWDIRTFQCVQTFHDEAAGTDLPKVVRARGKQQGGSSGVAAVDGGSGTPSTADDEADIAVGAGGGAGGHHELEGSAVGGRGVSSFDHSAKRNAIVSANRVLHVFPQGEDEHTELTTDTVPISVALVNATSLSILTAGGRNVKIWSALTGTLEREYHDITETDITAACLDDRERKFILGEHSGQIFVYNYATGSRMKALHHHTSEVTSLTYVSQGRLVLSSSWDQTVVVHDESQQEAGSLRTIMSTTGGGKTGADVSCADWSRQHGLAAAGGVDKTVRIWETEVGKLEARLKHAADITALCFLGDRPLLLCADAGGTMLLWGVGGSSGVKYGLILGWQHQPELWDPKAPPTRSRNAAEAGKAPTPVPVEGGESKETAVSPRSLCTSSEQSIASSVADGPSSAKKTGIAAQTYDGAPVTTMSWDDERQLLYTGDVTGRVTVWDLTAALVGIEEYAEHGLTSIRRMSIMGNVSVDKKSSRGGSTIPTALWSSFASFMPTGVSLDPDVDYWPRRPTMDASVPFAHLSGPHLVKMRWSIEAHRDSVVKVQYEPLLHCLITAGYDCCLHAWNTEDGTRVGTLTESVKSGRNPRWNMPIDVSGRIRNEMEGTKALLIELRKRQGRGWAAVLRELARRFEERFGEPFELPISRPASAGTRNSLASRRSTLTGLPGDMGRRRSHLSSGIQPPPAASGDTTSRTEDGDTKVQDGQIMVKSATGQTLVVDLMQSPLKAAKDWHRQQRIEALRNPNAAREDPAVVEQAVQARARAQASTALGVIQAPMESPVKTRERMRQKAKKELLARDREFQAMALMDQAELMASDSESPSDSGSDNGSDGLPSVAGSVTDRTEEGSKGFGNTTASMVIRSSRGLLRDSNLADALPREAARLGMGQSSSRRKLDRFKRKNLKAQQREHRELAKLMAAERMQFHDGTLRAASQIHTMLSDF